MNAIEVAKYFVELASETPEHDLTNLKLQKLLYYAQGKYLAKNPDALFNDKIVAWNYGPVVQTVYREFKQCGSFPITVFDMSGSANIQDAKTRAFIKDIWDSLGRKYSASYLVACTHANGTPWKDVYEPDTSNELTQDKLRAYFKQNKL